MIPAETIKEIKKLYNNGWTIEYISWEYNTTVSRVKDILTGNYEYNRDRSKK